MKLGILGGTFDPVHNGHIRAAHLAAKALGLELVLMVPTNIPPHKEKPGGASPLQRLEILRLAIGSDPLLKADACELERAGKSYSVDTVQDVARRYPGAELWFICGTDMFLTIHKWYKAGELLKLTGVAAVPRQGGEEEQLRGQKKMLEEKFGARVALVGADALELSSSTLRENGNFDGATPAAAAEYIKKNGLYA